MPAIEGLAGAGVPISADTFSVEVARRALAAGAVAVNDISGGSDEMFELVAESGCGYVLMHIEGPPRVDRPAADYGDVVEHLLSWFGGRVERARGLGVGEEQIAIDPGLDFDLSTEQDLEILRRLGELGDLGLPLYVSLSRKDFIGAVLAGSWEEPAAGVRARVGDGRRGRPRGARRRRHPPRPRPQLPAGGPALLAQIRGTAWTRLMRRSPCSRRPGRSRSTRRAATAGSSPRAPSPSVRRRRSRSRARSTRAWSRRSAGPASTASTRTSSRRSRRPPPPTS